MSLEKVQTLEQLNKLFRDWLSEGYNHKIHSALAGKSPAEAFSQDTKPLRFSSPETLWEAFLWEKTPQLDKSGCISLNGLCYEVGVEYIRKKVVARYDPFDLTQIEIWFGGIRKKVISPANFAEFNHNVKMPVDELEKASRSKLLRLLAAESKKRLKRDLGAFCLSEEGNQHDSH